MTSTTKGPAASTAEPFSTDRANGPHHIQAPLKEQNMPDQSNHFMPVIGQRVRYVRKIVESDGETVRVGQIGTVIEVRDNTPSDDVFGPVTVEVRMDHGTVGGAWNVGVFRPEELEPVHTDDTVPASAEEVTAYLTGTALAAPDVEEHPAGASHDGDDDQAHGIDRASAAVDESPSGMDWYECPDDACTFVIGAAGPLDPDEPDHFAEQVEEHRARHAREDQHEHAVAVARRALAAARDARADLDDVPELLDALPCPVQWCESDHTAPNKGFGRDAFESFSRFHTRELGGFRLDVVEKVTAAGEHFTDELGIGADFDVFGDPAEVAKDAREAAAGLLALTEVAATVALGPVTP